MSTSAGCRTGRTARTKDLIFTARLIEAPEALSLGLLNEVVLTFRRCTPRR
jgi:enoyl-CoA hydratase/carnithine racemase